MNTVINPAASSPGVFYADLVRPDRVHGSLYVRPEVFYDEMEHIFHSGWVYVGHESEVPVPHDFVRKRIGLQDMILSRDAGGAVRVLYDRCPHRGSRITATQRGRQRSFVCPYHAWAFDSGGTFLSMPAPHGFPPGCEADQSMAPAARVDTYGGFVFASLKPEVVPLREHLGHAMGMIDMLNGLSPAGKVGLTAGWMKHRLNSNWKGLLENQVDGYHPAVVHASLLRAKKEFASARDRKDTSASRARDLGNGHSEIDFAADFRHRDVVLGWTGPVDPAKLSQYVRNMTASYGEHEARRRLVDGPPHAVVFPNLFLAEMNIMVIEPVNAAETIQYTTPVVVEGGAELNVRSLRRCEGALGPAGFLFSDDAEISDRVQTGVTVRQPEWVLLRRGLGAELEGPDGTRTGDLKDETAQRGFWRHYRDLMMRGGS